MSGRCIVVFTTPWGDRQCDLPTGHEGLHVRNDGCGRPEYVWSSPTLPARAAGERHEWALGFTAVCFTGAHDLCSGERRYKPHGTARRPATPDQQRKRRTGRLSGGNDARRADDHGGERAMSTDRTPRHVRLRLTPGRASTVEIDGHDLANGIRSLRLDADAGSLPELHIDLAVIDVTEVESEQTRVVVPEATAEALRALGWTPPEQAEDWP